MPLNLTLQSQTDPETGVMAEPQVATNVVRDKVDPDPSRSALVERLQKRILEARKHWEKAFERMREDMRCVSGQQWPAAEGNFFVEPYVCNILQRAVSQKVAGLYAKNPKAVCRRRKKIDTQVWDGSMASVQMALATVQQAQQAAALGEMVEPPVASMATLQEYEHVTQQRKLLDGVARSLELVYQHQCDTQTPPFKVGMKQMVRRAVTCGVGYVRLGFERQVDDVPELGSLDRSDLQNRVLELKRRVADFADGEIQSDESGAEELRLMTEQLAQAMTGQQAMPAIRTERLTFSFPKATSVVVDPCCTALRGFVGAQWVAQEFILDPETVEAVYGVDVSKAGGLSYASRQDGYERLTSQDKRGQTDEKPAKVCVWELWDKSTGLKYTLCDGYKDFLCAPAAPDLVLERFYPIFPLVLNEIEAEESDPDKGVCIYPPSDVRLLMPLQREINRSREALRKHRISNRPKYAVAAGRLEQPDKDKLMSHPDSAVIEIAGLAPGEKVSDLIQPIPVVPIDPALYDTSWVIQDMLLVIGAQEANLGPTSGKTATESSIAESSRLTALGSNSDDLDDVLSELAECAGKVMLSQMSQQIVQSIVGPGAVWPTLDRDSIAREIYLEIEAGSSGRPNQSLEVQNFTQIAPLLMQVPGVSPEFLIREALKRMDDKLELADAIIPGMPAMQGDQQQQGQGGGQDSAKRQRTPSNPAATPGNEIVATPEALQQQALSADAAVRGGAR